MSDQSETIQPSVDTDGDPMRERLTAPQVEALNQIYELNMLYPKRWFTSFELIGVSYVTLASLINRKFLFIRRSPLNKKLIYFQYTGKKFENTKEDIFKDFEDKE